MKKIVWFLLVCTLVAANAMAEPGPPRDRGWGPPSPEMRADRLAEELTLDDEQKAKVLEIFTAADAERDALREQHEKQMREEACAHMNKVHSQIRAVLTDEQSDEFDEMMARRESRWKEHREHHGKRHGPPMGGPPMDCEGTDS